MIEGFVNMRRIKGPEEFHELVELAKVDKHGVYVPTHVLERDGKRIGYFSVGSPGVPIVFAWLSTEYVGSRESFHLINMVENFVALNGAVSVAFPVPTHSPFYPLMEKMGYAAAGDYTFFVKNLVER